MVLATFLNPKQTDCESWGRVKEAHKRLREQSVANFKAKAVGQNLKDFEDKIAEEISKKYVSIKQKCLKIYDAKCQESVAKEVEAIESMIRQEQVESMQDLGKHIEALKKSYAVNTAGIEYQMKELVITSLCEKLLTRGFESIQRRDRE